MRDTANHQHGRGWQLGVAGAEHLAAGAGKKVVVGKTGWFAHVSMPFECDALRAKQGAALKQRVREYTLRRRACPFVRILCGRSSWLIDMTRRGSRVDLA